MEEHIHVRRSPRKSLNSLNPSDLSVGIDQQKHNPVHQLSPQQQRREQRQQSSSNSAVYIVDQFSTGNGGGERSDTNVSGSPAVVVSNSLGYGSGQQSPMSGSGQGFAIDPALGNGKQKFSKSDNSLPNFQRVNSQTRKQQKLQQNHQQQLLEQQQNQQQFAEQLAAQAQAAASSVISSPSQDYAAAQAAVHFAGLEMYQQNTQQNQLLQQFQHQQQQQHQHQQKQQQLQHHQNQQHQHQHQQQHQPHNQLQNRHNELSSMVAGGGSGGIVDPNNHLINPLDDPNISISLPNTPLRSGEQHQTFPQQIVSEHSVNVESTRGDVTGEMAVSETSLSNRSGKISASGAFGGSGKKRKASSISNNNGTPRGLATPNLNSNTPGLVTPGSSSTVGGGVVTGSDGTGTSSNNDMEHDLKRSAMNTIGTPLEELVETVRKDDNSSLAEKSRQFFGMSWLIRNCELEPDANVPRNRIYARYVGLCSEYDLKPLNPASFGKLVRIMFPSIKTRRLGVRGQSKYHYCGIKLIGDQNNATGSTPIGTPTSRFGNNSPDLYGLRATGFGGAASGNGSEVLSVTGSGTPTSFSPYDTPIHHQQQTPSHSYSASLGDQLSRPLVQGQSPSLQIPQPPATQSTHSLGDLPSPQRYYNPHHQSQQQTGEQSPGGWASGPSITNNHHQHRHRHQPPPLHAPPQHPPPHELRFSANFNDSNDISLSPNSHEFTIPLLDPYLDPKTDPDASATLYALYKSHSRSLIEALRFMHVKKFFHILSVFIGGLTIPVQRLLKQEGIVAWVSRVDWIMYKEMVRLLSPLALQEIPIQVLHGLRSLYQFLPNHLAVVLDHMPPAFVEARIKPATAFARLLDRLLRVNEAALNAGKILVDEEDLTKMKYDWTRFVDARALVMREVPCGGIEVVNILQDGVVKLLTSNSEVDERSNSNGSDAGNDDENNNSDSHIDSTTNSGNDRVNGMKDKSGYTKSEASVVKWAQFLSSLPPRFPNVSPRLFLLCMSSVITSALRDISMNGGEGFGAWWVVRCWIDEWMGWTAELGGFLTYGGGQDISSNNAIGNISMQNNSIEGGNLSVREGEFASIQLLFSDGRYREAVNQADSAIADTANAMITTATTTINDNNNSNEDNYNSFTMPNGSGSDNNGNSSNNGNKKDITVVHGSADSLIVGDESLGGNGSGNNSVKNEDDNDALVLVAVDAVESLMDENGGDSNV